MAFGSEGKLMAVIADEDTCVGFLMGGIGEMDKNKQVNFKVIDKNSTAHDVEEAFKQFIKREDIDIIIISQTAAGMIRPIIDKYNTPVPAIIEIPSKEEPYDPSKDYIFQKAKGFYAPEDS